MFFRNRRRSLSKKIANSLKDSRFSSSETVGKLALESLERRDLLSADPGYGVPCTVYTLQEYLSINAYVATEQIPQVTHSRSLSFKEMLDSLENLKIEADSGKTNSNEPLSTVDLETKVFDGVECCSLRQLEALRVVFESYGLSSLDVYDEDGLSQMNDGIFSFEEPNIMSSGGSDPIDFPIEVEVGDPHTHASQTSGVVNPLLERFDNSGFSLQNNSSDYATITLPAVPPSYYSIVSLGGTASYGTDYDLYVSVDSSGVQGVSVSNSSFQYSESGGSTDFYLVPINDGLREADETATLTMGDLVPPISGGGDYNFDYICRSATATIIDDDHWQISVAETDENYVLLGVVYDENGNEIHTTLSERDEDKGYFLLTRSDDGSGRSGDYSYPVAVWLNFSGQANADDFTLTYYNSLNAQVESPLDANGDYSYISVLTIPESSSSTRLYIEATDDSYVERFMETVAVSALSAQSLCPGSFSGALSVDASSCALNISDNDLFVLSSVTFQNNLNLKSDTPSSFGVSWGSSTHWTNNNPSATLPIAYACDANMRCRAAVTGLKDDSLTFQVQAEWEHGVSEWVTLTNGIALATFTETILSQLGSRQALYDADFTLTWKFRVAGEEEARTFGESVNPLYITYKTPVSEAKLYHSVVHIGCAAATGTIPANTESEEGDDEPEEARLSREEGVIFDAIWAQFALLTMHKVKMVNGEVVEDDDLLTYYGKDVEANANYSVIKQGLEYTYDNGNITYDQSPSRAREFARYLSDETRVDECYETYGLLYHSDGTCGAWQDFAFSVFGAQGITVQKLGIFDSSGTHEFKVCPTLHGQGNIIPRENTWGDHAVFKYKDAVYDPSYGKFYGTYGTDVSEALSNFIENLDSIGEWQAADSNGYGFKYTPTKNTSQIQVGDLSFIYPAPSN